MIGKRPRRKTIGYAKSVSERSVVCGIKEKDGKQERMENMEAKNLPNGRTLTMMNDEILQHWTLKNVKGYIRLTCMYRSVNVNLPHNEVLKIYELLPPLCPHSIRQEYTITFSHLRITLDLYKNLYIKVFTNYLIINHVSTSAFLS